MTDNRTPSREALAIDPDTLEAIEDWALSFEQKINVGPVQSDQDEYVQSTAAATVELVRALRQTTPSAGVEEVRRLRMALDFVVKEAARANEVIRLGRSGGGQGRITVATALHRIENVETYARTDTPPVDESSQVAGEDEYVGRYTCRSCSEPTDNDSDVCNACEQDAAVLPKPHVPADPTGAISAQVPADSTAGDEARIRYTIQNILASQQGEPYPEASLDDRDWDIVLAALKSRDDLAARLREVEWERDTGFTESIRRRDRAIAADAKLERAKGALNLARPIVEADYQEAKEMCDADWEGMSFIALDAIDEALASLGSPSEGVK